MRQVDPRPLNTAGTCPMRAGRRAEQHCSVCDARIPWRPARRRIRAMLIPTLRESTGNRPKRPEGETMIAMGAIRPVEVEASISAEQAAGPKQLLKRKRPEGEGAVEIYCTKCGESATDGASAPMVRAWSGGTPSPEPSTIQWVYQTDKNYWAKVWSNRPFDADAAAGASATPCCGPCGGSQARRRALGCQRLCTYTPLATGRLLGLQTHPVLCEDGASARCIWIRIQGEGENNGERQRCSQAAKTMQLNRISTGYEERPALCLGHLDKSPSS